MLQHTSAWSVALGQNRPRVETRPPSVVSFSHPAFSRALLHTYVYLFRANPGQLHSQCNFQHRRHTIMEEWYNIPHASLWALLNQIYWLRYVPVQIQCAVPVHTVQYAQYTIQCTCTCLLIPWCRYPYNLPIDAVLLYTYMYMYMHVRIVDYTCTCICAAVAG